MFPTCPSCKQSVLDDDPVVCPFCGASMTAKPGAGKAAAAAPAKPAAAKPPATTAAAAPVRAPAKAMKPSSSAVGTNSFDASPLDLGGDFSSSAVALAPTRSKTRSLEVTCPMCDSVGYTTPDNAGRSVKCLNPKCPVPVFDAPRPAAEKPVAAKPAKRKSNVVGVGGATLAIMAVGGLIVWWIAGRPNDAGLKGPTAEDLELIKMQSDSSQPVVAKSTGSDAKTESKEPADKPAPKKTVTGPQALIGPMLTTLDEASLQRLNRSKPYCRRLSAEAFALAGDLKGAQKQLSALEKVGPEVPFYRVSPLVQITWQQLAKGQKKAAGKSVEDALAAAAKLPNTGRSRLEYVISLAAVLVAVDRTEDADKLLESHRNSDSIAELAKDLCAVQALGTFDLAEIHDRRPAVAWSSPLTVGVVYDLVGHQQGEVARKWADLRPTDRERAEAVAAWADAVAWNAKLHAQKIPVSDLRAAAVALPAPGNVFALARLGLSLKWAGEPAAATECLEQLSTELSQWEPAVDVQLPDELKELSKFESPSFDQGAMYAAAAGEAAHLAACLGQKDQADELLATALNRARALAPAPQNVQQRQKQIVAGGIAALRSRLKEEWKLKTDEAARVAANTLQKNLDQLAQSAQKRVGLQRQLLTEATEWGRWDAVWKYIRRDGSAAEMAAADSLFFTDLPALLADKYRLAGNTDQADMITAAWKQSAGKGKLARPFGTVLQEAMAAGAQSVSDQAKLLEEFRGEAEDLDGIVLRAVCRQAADGKLAAALNFAAKLQDPVLKEECFVLVAGMSARRLDTKAAEKLITEVQQSSDKVALGRGLIGGWVARQSLKASSTSTEQ